VNGIKDVIHELATVAPDATLVLLLGMPVGKAAGTVAWMAL
jgi:hypothetical protein